MAVAERERNVRHSFKRSCLPFLILDKHLANDGEFSGRIGALFAD